MKDWSARLHRLEQDGLAVYVNPEAPDWFVPSTRGDRLLKAAMQCGTAEEAILWYQARHGGDARQLGHDFHRLSLALDGPEPEPYRGRAAHLELRGLREVWYHLTDGCNLACRHCLFGSSPSAGPVLARDSLDRSLEESVGAGCRLFYFTGGEPFVYPGFVEVLARVQELHPGAHAVVLTNGLLLGRWLPELTALDLERLHLQVSLDGLEEQHDHLRGRGSFAALAAGMRSVRSAGLPVTVSVAVNRLNVDQLPALARLAHSWGAAGLHVMYHFVRGRGGEDLFAPPGRIADRMVETGEICAGLGLRFDNLEALQAQVFSMPGTRYDLSGMGWESLAVGPDGRIYPSPALVRVAALDCGGLDQGLTSVWRQSPVLAEVRRASLMDDPDLAADPLRFLTGGGDPDHSYVHGSSFVGHDPYLELANRLVLHLIVREAGRYPDQGLFRLRMGDLRFDCPDGDESGSDGSVSLTHCNCVVSLAGTDGHRSVREFYGEAARETRADIVNPFGPSGLETIFIPGQSTERSYGCGSPVKDADPQPGETLVDLGSGSGVECFLAAARVGPEGQVFGIDMTDDMLQLAGDSKKSVVERLGYDNIEFKKGFLESIPLEDGCADVVISNCVINLSPDKRRTYLEIARILKPGGRLIVSDIVTDGPVAPSIRNSARLRGECLGGAMVQQDLVQMLEDCGLTGIFFHSRSLYRQVGGDRFFSLTYEAGKPVVESGNDLVQVVYRGPHQALVAEGGDMLNRGRTVWMAPSEAAGFGSEVFVFDGDGQVVNVEQEPCCCAAPPEEALTADAVRPPVQPIARHRSGCMLCGAELVYDSKAREQACHFCGSRQRTNSRCREGHFICDRCHQEKALDVLRRICLQNPEQDMVRLLSIIRSHPALPMHGPEHHAMVPGIILAAYRNSGGRISREIIDAGIERGAGVPGGACGFWGSCGAAIGAGIAASLILEATPLTPDPRQQAQEFGARVLAAIAGIRGGRCCQRETWLALRETATLAPRYFGISLRADSVIHCSQYRQNRECIGSRCPLWEHRQAEARGMEPVAQELPKLKML
ncbi:DUF5714 domain-containing protein [Desulfolithobacter sp.]